VDVRTRIPRDLYARTQRSLVIRHSSDDRIVAMIEVLSPGSKSSRRAIRAFLDKVVAALDGGVHLLLLDVHPPGPRDPQGIHAAVLNEIGTEEYMLPADRPLTAVAYIGGAVVDAFVRHFAEPGRTTSACRWRPPTWPRGRTCRRATGKSLPDPDSRAPA
jgi:hypothetical protein